jgi:hypothetical protein
MKKSHHYASFLTLFAFTALLLAGNRVNAAEEAAANDPSVKHAPITTAVRGVPVEISALVEAAQGSSLTSVTVLVRVSDAGTPLKVDMAGKDDGSFNAVLPVTLIKNVNVFWYAIDARDSEGRIGGTVWYRVVILDAIDTGGGAGAEAKSWKKAAWIGGGLLVAGGAAAIIANQDDDDDNGNNNTPPPEPSGSSAPPPPPKENGGNDSPDLSVLTNFICNVTGNETASYENFSRCDGVDDILVLVCNTCLNADISATTSWGASDAISGFSNVGCNTSVPRLRLAKPRGFPTPGTETVTILVNGVVIDTQVWPPLSDNSCF